MNIYNKEVNDCKELYNKIYCYEKVIIYGAGYVGREILKDLIINSIDKDICFVTTIGEGTNIFGIPVKRFDDNKNKFDKKTVYIVAAYGKNKDEIILNCKNADVEYIVVSDSYKFYLDYIKELEETNLKLDQIRRKLTMANSGDVWTMNDVKIFVPNYPIDFIQKHIVDNNNFFEEELLLDLNQYIPEKSVIFDIGANIGNHTLYWSIKTHAEKVYSFEPVESTYKILEKNIMLNNLSNVNIFNVGCSDKDEYADFLTYRMENIGDTHLVSKNDGAMRLVRLDNFITDLQRLDFIKIDVEDYEVKVLLGMENIIKNFEPVIFIESYPDYFQSVDALMHEYGYTLTKKYPHHNYLYIK